MSDSMSSDVIRAEGLGKTYAEGSLHTQVFDGLDIAVAKGETVITSFTQTYKSPHFADKTKKALTWKLINNKWVIIKESNR